MRLQWRTLDPALLPDDLAELHADFLRAKQALERAIEERARERESITRDQRLVFAYKPFGVGVAVVEKNSKSFKL